MKKSRQDNSGFTLIELLIAMVIIAIVLTPLYNNFRQSTYLNGKAKAAMDATNMASNVMEGLSAYSAEEIIFGFYTYDSVSNNNPLRHSTLNFMPNEVTVADYGEVVYSGGVYSKGMSISAFSPDSAADYSSAQYVSAVAGGAPQPLAKYLQLKPTANSKYYFYAEGVTQARGTYDVLLELDASGASGFSGDLDGSGAIDGSEITSYNDYESPVLTNINPMYDGVYTESSGQRANAAAAFITKAKPGVSATEANVYPRLRRTMIITIDQFTGISGETITVSVEDKYVLTSGASDFTITELIVPGGTIFDSSTYGATPRNIYIYYSGNYNSTSTSGANCLDIFEINNLKHVPINIHLIRTKNSETTDITEGTYRAQIDVNEIAVSGTYATEVYSNLRDNLTMSAADNATHNRNAARTSFYLNATAKLDSSSEYKDIIHENGGVRTEKRDRLYAVTMYVYEEGAANAGFPADMLITEFDGNSAQ